ncbi:MAG: radical SAM family heme chaperone HemW [Candidatus Omnitrophota bacterium]
MQPIGIYVHIPFCVKKCGYCGFNSLVANSAGQIKAYLKALFLDIQLSAKNRQAFAVESIYIGGGTPSILEAKDIAHIIAEIKQCFPVARESEITIEVNPASVSRQKLLEYKKSGINRISMGVQSFKPKNLKFLGRAHSALDVFKALKMLKNLEFNNISIDLIYGLPDQSLKDWEDDLNQFIDCELSHLSLYDLTIEKGTPFYEIKNTLLIADNDLQALMYKKADGLLKKNQFNHYEISSFAKKGRQSKHNLIYWNNLDYIGLGAGAYSYINRQRFSKANDLYLYEQQAKKNKFEHYDSEKLSLVKLMQETLILRLRLLKGFRLKDIENKLNHKIRQDSMNILNEFVRQGFILLHNNHYKLSKKGLLQYDTIASELLS